MVEIHSQSVLKCEYIIAAIVTQLFTDLEACYEIYGEQAIARSTTHGRVIVGHNRVNLNYLIHRRPSLEARTKTKTDAMAGKKKNISLKPVLDWPRKSEQTVAIDDVNKEKLERGGIWTWINRELPGLRSRGGRRFHCLIQ